MIWRSGSELLVLSDGAYARIGADGSVVAWYGERSYSDEDDLWTWAHAVEGDALVARTTILHGCNPPRVVEEKVVLRGLDVDTSEAARRVVSAALAAAEVAHGEAMAARARAAEARLDAVSGARAEVSPSLASARSALADRIRRWDDGRAKALLETLVVVDRARVDLAVETAFARACLIAAFERDLPPLPAEPVIVPHPALAARLAAHADTLARDSEDQANVDAHANAATLANAARAMRLAAQWLGAKA